MPKAKKTSINSVFDVLIAYPKALPIKGAVQGVATTTVNAPLRKLPKNPEKRSYDAKEPELVPNSKNPNKFNAIRKKRNNKQRTNDEFCN